MKHSVLAGLAIAAVAGMLAVVVNGSSGASAADQHPSVNSFVVTYHPNAGGYKEPPAVANH
jgi:hypothetical protein